MKDEPKNLQTLIEELKKYDNKEGYRLSYVEVTDRLQNTLEGLVEKGEAALEQLHLLLEREETWSCFLALQVIKEIKSKSSIPHLIDFIHKNEYSDYWEGCEDAMLTLSAIGEPAIEPLLEALKSDFNDHVYHPFLVGSLTKIKHPKVYSFMKETLEDFIEHYTDRIEWFNFIDFILDFDKQEKKEILPLLEELLSIEDLSEHERREVQNTISVVKDPEAYWQRHREEAVKLEPLIGRTFSTGKKIGRNDPCPCGSGKKYKKCCMKKEGVVKEDARLL